MTFRIATAAVAALALPGCGAQTKPAAESSDATPPAASAVATSSAARTAVPPRDFLIGKWGTNGDCTMAMDLRPDGTSDGPFGNWTYADGVIGFTDAPDLRISVSVIDDNSMQSTNDDGKTSTMTRCP